MRGGVWVAVAATLGMALSMLGNLATSTVQVSTGWTVTVWIIVTVMGIGTVAVAVRQHHANATPSPTLERQAKEGPHTVTNTARDIHGQAVQANRVGKVEQHLHYHHYPAPVISRGVRASWWYKLTTARRVSHTAMIGAIVIVAMWVGVTGSSPSTAHAKVGANTSSIPPASTVQDVGLSVALSEDSFRLVLYLNNLQAREQSVGRMHLIISFDGPPCAELAPVILYDVRDMVTAETSGEISQGSVAAESGPMSGFHVPATGLINYGCGRDQLQLSFVPPGAILERIATTPIAIDVPRNIHVNDRKIPNSGPSVDLLAIPGVEDPAVDGNVAFRVVTEIRGTNKIDSCFLFSRLKSSGPRDCNYQDNGIPVFWRQVFVSEGEVRYER